MHVPTDCASPLGYADFGGRTSPPYGICVFRLHLHKKKPPAGERRRLFSFVEKEGGEMKKFFKQKGVILFDQIKMLS